MGHAGVLAERIVDDSPADLEVLNRLVASLVLEVAADIPDSVEDSPSGCKVAQLVVVAGMAAVDIVVSGHTDPRLEMADLYRGAVVACLLEDHNLACVPGTPAMHGQPVYDSR